MVSKKGGPKWWVFRLNIEIDCYYFIKMKHSLLFITSYVIFKVVKKLLSVTFSFILILNILCDMGFASDTSHDELSLPSEYSSSLHQEGKCNDSGSNNHDGLPFDCHDCIGHCHSSHTMVFNQLDNLNLNKLLIKLITPTSLYKDLYKSTDLSNPFRPPIFS